MGASPSPARRARAPQARDAARDSGRLALVAALAFAAACSAGGESRSAPGAARGPHEPAHAARELAIVVLRGPDVGADRRPSPAGEHALARARERAAGARPGLALVCGGLVARDADDGSWSAAAEALDALGVPWLAAAGDADVALGAALDGFRQRFGGLVHASDHGGAHFVALATSAPMREPVATLSPLQLAWLREDLARNANQNPVFLLLHHAPQDLPPSQLLSLRAALDGHEVAAVFCGTPARGASPPGLPVVSVAEHGALVARVGAGMLRVEPAEAAGGTPSEPERPLPRRERPACSIEAPADGEPARDDSLRVAVRAPAGVPPRLSVDGAARAADWDFDDGLWSTRLSTSGLDGGVHQLAVEAPDGRHAPWLGVRSFVARSPAVEVRWRRSFEGAFVAAPALDGERVLVASTAGEVAALDAATGEVEWSARTAAVVVPPLADGAGGAIVGTVAGWVEARDREGVLRWRHRFARPVLAELAVSGSLVFAADSAGALAALELATGRPRWTFDGGGAARADALELFDATGEFAGAPDAVLRMRTPRGTWWLDPERGTEVAPPRLPAPERLQGRARAGSLRARAGPGGLVELGDDAHGPGSVWRWRASPDVRLAAPPRVREDGTVLVAGLDGWVSALRAR